MVHPMAAYYNGLGCGDIDLVHCPLQSTTPCPNCGEGKLTIVSFKNPRSRYFVCTHTRISSLGMPVCDVGCGHVAYRIMSIVVEG